MTQLRQLLVSSHDTLDSLFEKQRDSSKRDLMCSWVRTISDTDGAVNPS